MTTKNTATKARKPATPAPAAQSETIYGVDVSGPDVVAVAVRIDMNDPTKSGAEAVADALKSQ